MIAAVNGKACLVRVMLALLKSIPLAPLFTTTTTTTTNRPQMQLFTRAYVISKLQATIVTARLGGQGMELTRFLERPYSGSQRSNLGVGVLDRFKIGRAHV